MEISTAFLDERNDTDEAIWERKTLVWAAFAAGLALGFVAVYIIVAQPVITELRDLHRQTNLLQMDVRELVGARQPAWEAGSLLSELTSLKSQLADSRAALREIKQLRKDLLEESRYTAAASGALREFGRLQDAALENQDLIPPAQQSIERISQLQQRLIETTVDLPRAYSAAGQLAALTDQIADGADELEAARAHASHLLTLQHDLVGQGETAQAAHANLANLLQMQEQLADRSSEIASAVQNLEVLSDYQDELSRRLGAFAQMRTDLTQVLLMETTIARVTQVLQPLAQIVNLRRLSDQELRQAARAILDSRSDRLASRPADATTRTPGLEAQPEAPELRNVEKTRSFDEISDLGADRSSDALAPADLSESEPAATN